MIWIKLFVSAGVISFASWLSGRKPELAGFIIALPLASLLALAFSYAEHKDAAASITFAKSILLAVPASWLFFLPFFVADRFQLGFWACYAIGLALLGLGYGVHQSLLKFFS